MRLSKKELLFLRVVTHASTLAGSFDFENNNEKQFKEHYGISMNEVDEFAEQLHDKILDKLATYKSLPKSAFKKL